MKQKFLVAAIALGFLSACAHTSMRGSVAMKINEREAHVCMNHDEVKVGDKVTLYRNHCSAKGKSSDGFCQKQKLGTGEVTQILNDHYSLVRFQEGVKFDEGSFVEKE